MILSGSIEAFCSKLLIIKTAIPKTVNIKIESIEEIAVIKFEKLNCTEQKLIKQEINKGVNYEKRRARE